MLDVWINEDLDSSWLKLIKTLGEIHHNKLAQQMLRQNNPALLKSLSFKYIYIYFCVLFLTLVIYSNVIPLLILTYYLYLHYSDEQCKKFSIEDNNIMWSVKSHDLGLSFFPLYKASSDTLATFTTLNLTPAK